MRLSLGGGGGVREQERAEDVEMLWKGMAHKVDIADCWVGAVCHGVDGGMLL
jgi:hypothetical protein